MEKMFFMAKPPPDCAKKRNSAKKLFRQPPHRQRHLRDKYRRHAVLELLVLGLVVPHLHPQPRPDAAA